MKKSSYNFSMPVKLPANVTLDAPPQALKLPSNVTLDSVEPQAESQSKPSFMDNMQHVNGDVLETLKGMGKGALSTLSSIGQTFGDTYRQNSPYLSASEKAIPKEDVKQNVNTATIAHGTLQKIGKAGEQIGEFAVPGGAEESGAAHLAELAPRLGKYAEPLAHVLASAAGSGAVNAAQGRSPAAGAIMGAGGQIIGQGLKMAAPAIAETAMGMKTPGRATGKAILDETSGLTPGGIRSSVSDKLNEIGQSLRDKYDAASVRKTPLALPAPVEDTLLAPAPFDPMPSTVPNESINLQPTRDIAAANTGAAQVGKSGKTYKAINKLSNMTQVDNAGEVIPQSVTPTRAWQLRQALDDFLPKASWNPSSKGAVIGARNQLRGSLNNALDEVAPEGAALRARYSALVPARTETRPFLAPTLGAGGGALYGGYLGGREGGLPGAIKGAAEGGLAGAIAPSALMGGARLVWSPALGRFIVPSATGGTLQMMRSQEDANQ